MDYYLKFTYGDYSSFMPILADSIEDAKETARTYPAPATWTVTAITSEQLPVNY